MTELEAREKLISLKEQVNTVISTGEAESRELNEAETNTLAELRQQIADVEAELANIEAENRNLAKENETKNNNKEIKTRKHMKLVSLINAVANNTVTDEMRAYVEGNKITMRASDPGAIVAGQEGYGQENVPEDKKSLDVAIRNASVLNRMGCTWFSNAVGNISLPRYSGSQVGWKGEIEAADDGKGTFDEVILEPKRLTAFVDVSRTFLAQDSNDAENILINDIAAAIAEHLDKTVMSADSGTTTQPAGIFLDAATGNTLSGMTYDNVLALESAVEEHNGYNFIFVANPRVKYQLKGQQMASGLNMVWNAGEIDGYKAIVSNSVVEGGLACLDPRDLVATWGGGVQIVVDTVSRAIYNEVRLVVNYLVDAKLKGDRIATEIFE